MCLSSSALPLQTLEKAPGWCFNYHCVSLTEVGFLLPQSCLWLRLFDFHSDVEPGPHASCLSALSVSLPVGGQRRGYDNRAYGQQYWGQSGNRGVSAALLLLLPLGRDSHSYWLGGSRAVWAVSSGLRVLPI